MTETKPTEANTSPPFSGYQKLVVAMLALLQFSIILDFMLMAPLGAIIMPALAISPKQFGLVVSAYAFSAGISGLVTAGFADRFDRKKLLLFFFIGFLLGTLWCGMAESFESLLLARIATGIFGGVIGSVVMAITTDLFPITMRGRVMGMIQTAFAASQVLGLPTGLYLSNHWGWHATFLAMAGFGLLVGLFVIWKMEPVDAHLRLKQEHSPWMHLFHTLADPRHIYAFTAVCFLTTGGFMLMPFSSAYTVNNLEIGLASLPTIYLVTGICTIFFGPAIGKAADAVGKFPVYLFGTALSITMVLIYTHLSPVPLGVLIVVNTILFVGIFSRMIPFQALSSSIPKPTHRGSFSAISSAVQQFSGGIASVVAGHIVTATESGRLEHMDMVGYVVVTMSLLATFLVWNINRQVNSELAAKAVAAGTQA
jgi:predicted MFS family arabinose efflux permease